MSYKGGKMLLCLSFAALWASVLAQDGTTTFSSTTTSTSASSQAFTTTISVGLAENAFSPDVVQVPVGGFVEFDFYPTNHSVIRAEYKFPCVPYELTGVGKVGFFSGFQPVDAILGDPPKWTLQINDSNPVFYYCGAPNSCLGWGMVGVINPNASVSVEVQKDYALNGTIMLEPGQPWPDESNPFATTSTSTFTATQTTTATSTQSTSPATATGTSSPDVNVSHKSALSAGGIAGVAIAGAVVVLAAAALLFFCGRRSRRSAASRADVQATPASLNPPGYAPLSNNYGYASPANKRMSDQTLPTDAFGNPLHNSGMYAYPMNYQQGYPPPQMQQNPMGNHGPLRPSPSNEIFGTLAPPVQHMSDTQPGTEDHSVRASSPSSIHAMSPVPVVGGIAAFLSRQDPHAPPESDASGPNMARYSGTGPYEMSSSATHMRQ